MHALNFHIDTMSMMGLSLIIGILVDASIVSSRTSRAIAIWAKTR